MGLTRIRAEQISNIDYKQSVRVITTANVNLTGGAPAIVDGVTLLVGNRILVSGQTDRRQNGIYQVSTVGAGNTGTWIRSRDANETGEIEAGMIVMVTEGTVYKDTQWKLTTNDPIVVDETELDFQRNTAYDFGNIYANGTAVLATVAGDTVTLEPGVGVTIAANASSKTITISAGTANPGGNAGEVQYNSGANTLAGSLNLVFDGSNLTVGGNIAPLANMQYDLGNATNYWRSLYVGGNTIYLGNIELKETEDGGFGVYQANGGTPPVNVGNITIANSTISSTDSIITIDPSAAGETGLVIIAGNLQVQGTTTTIDSTVVTIDDLAITVANNATSASQANGGGIVIAGADASMLYNNSSNSLVFSHSTVHNGANINGALTGATTGSFSSNVSVGNISAEIGAFTTVTGNGAGLSSIAGANVTGTVANATYATSAGSATTAGTVTTNAQPNITSVGTLTSLVVTGNVTVGNISATTGTFVAVSGDGSQLSNISGAEVTGTVASASHAITADSANLATTAGTVTTNAQPNITSVGTLLSLTVAGNVSTGNISGTTGGFATVIGDGSGLSNIAGANVTGTVANATYATSAGSATSATTAGTVTTAAQPNITSVGTLTSLTVTGNVSGGNLTTAGNITATGNIEGSYFIGNGSLLTGINTSGVKWTTSATAPASPNPGDFWYDTDDDKKYQYTNFGTGNAWVDLSFPSSYSILAIGNLTNTNANGVGNIGSAGGYYNTVFAKATSAQYADLAEMYQADAAYEPGTVVVFGGDYEVSVSTTSHDTRVAGVVSTNPSYLMNAGLNNETAVAVALTGRVPCWVQGPVDKGDRLVNHKSGVAGKLALDQFEPGCIIGKSLEIIEDDSIKLIEIAIGRY